MDEPNVVVITRSAKGWQAVMVGHSPVAARSLQALDKRIQQIVAGKVMAY